MRLLLVEDDQPIAQGLSQALQSQGHAVDVLNDGRPVESAISGTEYDLVILDLGLPDMDGLTILRKLRESGDKTPVLVLTARDETAERVKALNYGADDYVVKPFDLSEVEARIRAIVRRAIAGGGGDLVVGNLVMSMSKRSVLIDKKETELSPREFSVLEILMLNNGRVVSKAQIQGRLCGWGEELAESAIELYVHRIRKKIENSGVRIRTVRGFGYLLGEAA